MKKLKQLISLVILTAIISIAISRVNIEYHWFSQFNLASVLIKRWSWQVIGTIVGGLITLLFYCWVQKWRSLPLKITTRTYTTNIQFTIITVTSIIFHTLSTYLILISFHLSLIKPFDFVNWRDSIVNYNHSYLFPVYILITCIFSLIYSKKYFNYVHILFGVAFSFIVGRLWGLWTLAISITDTGYKEPFLGSDISFSIGQFPALFNGLVLVLLLSLFTISTSISSYFITPKSISDWSVKIPSPRQIKYIKRYIGFVLFVISLLLWLSRYQSLWIDDGIVSGAGWLDHHWVLPLRTISSVSVFLISLILIFDKFRLLFNGYLLLFPILASISEVIFLPFIDWIIVKPRELTYESKYISRSINSTRSAFQLDAIKTTLINPKPELEKRDLLIGEGTLKNIRLWDSQPLLATNRQLQQLRLYYKFSSASVDRYLLQKDSNQRQQVIITARELDQDSLPDKSRTWLNKHFVFTHGYGFTLSPVNSKAEDGLPEYFISDLGTSTKIQGSPSLGIQKSDVMDTVPIGRAAIYFGLFSSPYAIAPTKLEEFDYPEGDKNIYTHYEGNAGIPISNFIQRITAAIYLSEPRILNTGVLNNKSKLILRREVRQRVKALAPFIELKGDPYLISTKIESESSKYDDQQYQYWIVEGYTSSSTYPYSSPIGKRNTRYIRNSVKIIVDAYSGLVNFYINEPHDPIIKAWSKLFPEMFSKIEDMPTNIRSHLKVPTELFDIQVKQLLKFHVTDPRTFYNGDDVWQVPKEIYAGEQIPVEPYHITAQLKPNDPSEFLLLQPLTPLARPNLSAWLAARSDGENYGELVLLRFPSQTTIFGPEQIQALINQDPQISQQFSLWDRAGSEVIQGNLLVLPVGKSLLYVEPVYLKASKGGLPTLTRVVVSDGKRIAMEATLSEGLEKLLEEK